MREEKYRKEHIVAINVPFITKPFKGPDRRDDPGYDGGGYDGPCTKCDSCNCHG